MGKGKKQSDPWKLFAKCVILSLGIYLLGQILLAALLVNGTLKRESAFTVLAALAVLATLAGGSLCVKRFPWGTLPGGIVFALIFGGVITGIGAACWKGITWSGQGGLLLCWIMAGGLLCGILGGIKGKRKTPKRRKAL